MTSLALTLGPDELVTALRSNGANAARTARALGVSEKAIRCAIRRMGISVRAVRDFADDAIRPRPPREARARRLRPLVRVLPLEACDVPRRVPLGTSNGSGCGAVVGELAAFEVTEIVARNIAVELPVETVNSYREHWGQRQRRRAKVHRAIQEALGAGWTPPQLPEGWRWVVTFTRYALLRQDDDNCIASFKAHRDAVADILGLNDRDKRVSFRVGQAKWSERAQVRRWDRVAKRYELRPGFRCFFRVRIEQVKAEGTR